MNAISRENILNKTHYGLKIYSHILRLYYPDEVVMRLVERDCGLCRNPFNSNKKTLHIWIEKTNPANACRGVSHTPITTPACALYPEYAHHSDTENAIPAGNAFDFAALHYKQQGAELLQTLNQAMNLRIGEKWDFYRYGRIAYAPQSPNSPNAVADLRVCTNLNNPNNQINQTNHSSDFSFFKAPITNTTPHKTATLLQIYNAIKGNYYKEKTHKLRKILSPPLSFGEGQGVRWQARRFKAANFDYCTFSGVFTTRTDKALIRHSGLLCIDFDHLQNLDTLRTQLLQDEYFETQLLFVSPSGNGLKWVITIPSPSPSERGLGGEVSHADYFTAVSNYIKATYNVEVDKSGKDLSRACFLPHDSEAYINPQIRPIRSNS